MNGNPRAEALVDNHETIGSRETYYVSASLDKDPLFCGDDRGLEGLYAQLFGGVINIAYNQAIVEEANEPGGVTDSLQRRTEELTGLMVKHGMYPGVHSDTKSEQGSKLRDDHEGKAGCAYAELRPVISGSIAELGDDLLEEAVRLMPELFRTEADHVFGQSVIAAHGRLAEREGFQSTGRKLVLGAAEKGALVAILGGEHVASDGIINTVPNSTLDSKTAGDDGLPAYNHDMWAAEDALDRLGSDNPYTSDPNQRKIANLIDALGTMNALGVEAIAVRR